MNPTNEEPGVYYAYLLHLWRSEYQGAGSGAPPLKARIPVSASCSLTWSNCSPSCQKPEAINIMNVNVAPLTRSNCSPS